MINIRNLLPDSLVKIQELACIAEIQQIFVDDLYNKIMEFSQNLNIYSCDEEIVERLEKIFEINPELNAPISDRINNILSRLQMNPPIKISMVSNILKNILDCEPKIDIKDFLMTIHYRNGKPNINYLTTIKRELYNIIPASFNIDLKYNYQQFAEFDKINITFKSLDNINIKFDEFDASYWQ